MSDDENDEPQKQSDNAGDGAGCGGNRQIGSDEIWSFEPGTTLRALVFDKQDK